MKKRMFYLIFGILFLLGNIKAQIYLNIGMEANILKYPYYTSEMVGIVNKGELIEAKYYSSDKSYFYVQKNGKNGWIPSTVVIYNSNYYSAKKLNKPENNNINSELLVADQLLKVEEEKNSNISNSKIESEIEQEVIQNRELEKKVDANHLRDSKLDTKLLLAAKKGEFEKIKDLLNKGAYINSFNKKGETALILAAQKQHENIVIFLIENGANSAIKDNKGETAIDKVGNTNFWHTTIRAILKFDEVKKTNTIEAFEEFLSGNQDYNKKERTKPDKELVAKSPIIRIFNEAQDRLEYLYLLSEWENVVAKNSIVGYQNFLSKHPDTEFSGKIKFHLENLLAKNDWEKAISENVIVTYENFIRNHQNSEHINDARSRLNQLTKEVEIVWMQTKETNTIQSYENFIRKFPKNKNTPYASNQIEILSNIPEVEKIRESIRQAKVEAPTQKYISIVSFQETHDTSYCVYKGKDGQYYKIVAKSIKERNYPQKFDKGLDVPFLKHMKAYEGVVIYLSISDIINRIDNNAHVARSLIIDAMQAFNLEPFETEYLMYGVDEREKNKLNRSRDKKYLDIDIKEYYLASILTQSNVDSLINILNTLPLEYKKLITTVFGRLEIQRSTKVLYQLLEDRDYDLRKIACEAIQRLEPSKGFKHFYLAGEVGIEYLIEDLTISGKDEYTAEKINALVQIGEPTVQPIIKALKNYGQHSSNLIRALGLLGNPQAVNPLISTLVTYPYLGEEIKNALVQIGSQSVEKLVVALKDNSKASGWEDMVWALNKLGWEPSNIEEQIDLLIASKKWDKVTQIGPAAVGQLILLVQDTAYDHVNDVIKVLGDIKDERAVDPLAKILKTMVFSDKSMTISALEKIGSQDAMSALYNELTDWLHNEKIANILIRSGWRPQSDDDRIHLWVARRQKKDLLNNWDITTKILLKDIDSGNLNAIRNAIYTFIGIGRKNIIPDLINRLNSAGSREMAEIYLNCGSQQLETAAQDWARRHGYRIFSSGAGIPVSWGSF